MIDQKPRDPLYPQGFEDIDNLKNRQIPRPKPKENEDNDLKILKSFNQKLGKYIGPKPKNIIENEGCPPKLNFGEHSLQIFLIRL